MAKPWARYQVGFINHPKFRALPGNAIGLWLEGKNYADEHLTDGFIPMAVVKAFRFYSKRNLDLLMTSAGPKDVTAQEHYAPLWVRHGLGVKMHDYLAHNDDAATVRARIKAVGQLRDSSTARVRAWRERRQRERRRSVTPPVTGDVTPPVTPKETLQTGFVTPFTETDTEIPPNPPSGGGVQERANAVLRAAESTLLAADEVAAKAAAFLESYPDIYAACRHGATYSVREARDFPTALELVTAYPDPAHLRDMLRLFLLRTDRGWNNRPGAPRQFAYYAPQCDAELREARGRRAS